MAKKDKSVKTIVASKITTKDRFKIEESYKIARTNLSFSLLKEGCKKVTIIGSMNREGKTTTAVNLAISLAQQIDTKVLLIDCDLRRPRTYQFFNVDNTPGLTDCLTHSKELNDIINTTFQENLYIITSGTLPPNPSEILASEYFEKLIATLEQSFDYIIFDTSPINMVADAVSVAKLSDGVVISVLQSQSTHTELNKTIELLNRVDVKILGFILNAARDSGKKGYGYNYNYY